MRRKVEFILLALLITAALVFVIIDRPEPAHLQRSRSASPSLQESAQETTIRNVTDSSVSYGLRSAGGTIPAPRRRTLAPGAIDRVRTAVPLEIMFKYGELDMTFSIDPGQAYSFRYDEEGRIRIYLGSHGRADALDLAPFVPTPMPVVEKMLELAAVTDKDVLYDIGCGDGRIVITAAKRYGARGVGIDIDGRLVLWSRVSALLEGVDPLVRFIAQDATKIDLYPATVVTLYLLPESNELLRTQLEAQLRPGTRVVSHNYTMPGWRGSEIHAVTVQDQTGHDHWVYVYRR